MSDDHAIAKSIRVDLGGTPIRRVLSNGKEVEVPISSSGRNVLCSRHNGALHTLDDVGRRFVRSIHDAVAHQHGNAETNTHVLLNGFDVERWMLKVLCTMAHDEPISRFHQVRHRWTVPAAWVQILFGRRPFPVRAGIYLPKVKRGRYADGIMTAKITAVTQGKTTGGGALRVAASRRTVSGISFCLYGWDFDLLMLPPVDVGNYYYRVRMYRQRSRAGGVAHIHLGWGEHPPTFAGRRAEIETSRTEDPLLRR